MFHLTRDSIVTSLAGVCENYARRLRFHHGAEYTDQQIPLERDRNLAYKQLCKTGAASEVVARFLSATEGRLSADAKLVRVLMAEGVSDLNQKGQSIDQSVQAFAEGRKAEALQLARDYGFTGDEQRFFWTLDAVLGYRKEEELATDCLVEEIVRAERETFERYKARINQPIQLLFDIARSHFAGAERDLEQAKEKIVSSLLGIDLTPDLANNLVRDIVNLAEQEAICQRFLRSNGVSLSRLAYLEAKLSEHGRENLISTFKTLGFNGDEDELVQHFSTKDEMRVAYESSLHAAVARLLQLDLDKEQAANE
ncbi:MAG: hypothetical protein OXU45_02325 [Candidatus Melainabacteria bacterium]|nr:hypothetical protein [Candidatus Melainabacteria bacterium]